ncbi:N-6 DNA methylase [Nocardia sp. NPDC004568]|uniref:N-6 DNA methylase n=1 Tax=Nocardia sp. NPDC004568 TaxID=3154551 RepID=UPI0033BA73B5
MPETASLVTAAEISRLAGVTRATVSNWRRRHPGFPSPAGGSEARPVFDLAEVRQWLGEHGKESTESPLQELRTVLRAEVAPQEIPRLLEALDPHTGVVGAPGDADENAEVWRLVRAAVAEAGLGATVDALAERGLEEGPTTGVYNTPDEVAELMADLARATGPIEAVLDPACGRGGLLAAAVHEATKEFYGQDVLPVQARRAALTVAAAGSPDIEVDTRVGDSLLADAFADLTVHAVLCNPPSAQRDWGADELALDRRWTYGVPPRGESELAWVQHALAHLEHGGTAVLLLPPAVASRGSGRRIRGELLRRGVLRAVIGLPAGAAPPRHLGLQVWVLVVPDPGETPDEVLFVDTAALAQPVDTGDQIDFAAVRETVLRAWLVFTGSESGPLPDVAAAVRVMDVLDEDVDLTPGRHVRAVVDADRTADAVTAGVLELAGEIGELGVAYQNLPGFRGVEARTWRTATVADLAKGGALEILMPRPRRDEDLTSDDPDRGRAVLTTRDLLAGTAPSGTAEADRAITSVVIKSGDVVMPTLRGLRDEHPGARVAGADEAGALLGPNMFLLRPAPGRLDAWFLAGFLTSPDNAAAAMGATTIRVVPSRLRVPLLPLEQQEHYGAMFQRLHRLRTAARRAERAAAQLTGLIHTGLTAGALEPHDPPADDTRTTSPKGRK